jgi:hypothetical protein
MICKLKSKCYRHLCYDIVKNDSDIGFIYFIGATLICYESTALKLL